MPSASPSFDLFGALTLQEIRRFLRQTRMRPLGVFVAIVYALASMLWGGMLSLVPIHGGTTVEVLTGTGTGLGWWNYPGLLVVAPWGVLALPFFPTFAMIVVAVGVGLGMAVAAALILRLLRPSPEEVARSKAVGALTGLTPAMISLVTLGSCCTTTAAATGGIGLIAQASGSSTTNLLLNNWYLGVAQMVIVWAALLGQELLLTVYGGLLGSRTADRRAADLVVPPLDRRWLVGALLRGTLVIGGILWSISMLAEWTTDSMANAGAGWWFRWIVQHQLLAGVAITAGFFPVGTARVLTSWRAGRGRYLSAGIAAAAVSLLIWLPPPLPAWGLDSLGSQVAGAIGFPVSWGAIPLGAVTGVGLLVRWVLEYLVIGGFALAAALGPRRAFGPLLATIPIAGPEPEESGVDGTASPDLGAGSATSGSPEGRRTAGSTVDVP